MDKESFFGRGTTKTPTVGTPAQTKTQVQPPKAMDPFYKKNKSIGSAGATLDFSRMLEFVLRDENLVSNLPKKLQNGLRKVYKMTRDPFKYASEDPEAAVDTETEPATKLQSLGDTLTKLLHSGNLPKSVMTALMDAKSVVDKEMSGNKPDPLETPREQREEQKREKVIQQYTQKQQSYGREDTAIERLKKMFQGSKHYADIYLALPIEIRKELEKLSMDPDNLKYMSSERAVYASQESVIELYFGSLGQ